MTLFSRLFCTVPCLTFGLIDFCPLRSKFKNIGDEFILLSNHNIRAVFSSLESLSTQATSLVQSQQEETDYPEGFITIPHAEDQMVAARNATGALVVAYMPKVKTSDYDKWIEYAELNKGWRVAVASGVIRLGYYYSIIF